MRDLFWRMRGAARPSPRRTQVRAAPDGVDHLYDLGTDAHEQADIARHRPAQVQSLRRAWETVDATLLPYPA